MFPLTMRGSRRTGRRRSGDRGVVLAIFALAMVAILIVVALVIDYGVVRSTRQDNKSTADSAAAAGARALAPDAIPRPWRAACGALSYLKANQPGRTLALTFRNGANGSVSGDPCSDVARLAQLCGDSSPATWASITATDGEFTAEIAAGYRTPDARFAEDAGAYAGDNSTPCKQIAVIVSNSDRPFFGQIAGASDYKTSARTVGRVEITNNPTSVPAFLMLERRSCGVLSHSVGTGGGEGIIVQPASTTEGGVIHLDSSGVDGCSGTSENNFTLYGTTIGSNPGIIAQSVTTGTTTYPGIISLRAIEVGNTAHAYGTPTGVSPTPVAGKVISRAAADRKYNPPSPSTSTISDLHADAQPKANWTAAPVTAPPAPAWRTITTCSGHTETVTQSLVFVNCPSGYSPSNVTFANATEIVINGPVHVSNGSQLYMPAAQNIVIGGTGSRGLEVSNGGRIGVNSVSAFPNDDAGVVSACAGRNDKATDGWTNTTRLTIFGGGSSGAGAGALNVAGRAAMCQTFAYLAGPKTRPTYVKQSIEDGTYDVTCVPETPCPKTSGNPIANAHFDISGRVFWSAPNQMNVQPDDGDAGVEDLALWTETASLSEVKAGGFVQAKGVLFLPNGRAEMRSPATAEPQDAQFIARSLKLFQGTLKMRPTAANAVRVPILASVQLVR